MLPWFKSPRCNAGNTRSIPGGGRSHTLQDNLACASQLLSPRSGDHGLQQEKPLQGGGRAPQLERSLCCPRLEKACLQQPRPIAAKNKGTEVSPSHRVVSPRNPSGCSSDEDTLCNHQDLITEDRLDSNASPVSNTRSICRFLQVSDQPQVSMPSTGDAREPYVCPGHTGTLHAPSPESVGRDSSLHICLVPDPSLTLRLSAPLPLLPSHSIHPWEECSAVPSSLPVPDPFRMLPSWVTQSGSFPPWLAVRTRTNEETEKPALLKVSLPGRGSIHHPQPCPPRGPSCFHASPPCSSTHFNKNGT